VQDAVLGMIRSSMINAAHDCSEGGLLVALAEMCYNPKGLFGARIEFPFWQGRPDTLFYNESQSRIIVTCRPENASALVMMLKYKGVSATRLGTVSSDKLEVTVGSRQFEWPVSKLYDTWYNSIARLMNA